MKLSTLSRTQVILNLDGQVGRHKAAIEFLRAAGFRDGDDPEREGFVLGSWFEDQDLGFRIERLGLRDLNLRVWNCEFRVEGYRLRMCR